MRHKNSEAQLYANTTGL